MGDTRSVAPCPNCRIMGDHDDGEFLLGLEALSFQPGPPVIA